MAEMGARVPAPKGILGAPSDPHALRPEKNQAAAGTGGCPSCICTACDHAVPAPPGPRILARMGYPAGARLSAGLLSRRRAQRLSGANASQSAGVTEAPLQGVDGFIQLRLSCLRRDDTCLALFQAGVSRPF